MSKSDWKSFFDRDFLKNTLAALGGALSALMIYYLLNRLEKRKVNSLAAERDHRRLMYLGGLVQAGQTQTQLFLDNLGKLIGEMKSSPIYFPSLAPLSEQHLQRLSNLLNQEDYFEAYIDQFGQEQMAVYHELSSSVDFFIAQDKELRTLLAAAQDEDLKRKSIYVSMVYDLLKRGADVLELVALNGAFQHEEVKKIYDRYHQQFESYENLPYHQEYFIKPMLSQVFQNVDSGDPVLIELSTAFKSAHNLYEEIERQQVQMQLKLKELLEVYQNRSQLFNQQAEPIVQSLEERSEEEQEKKEKKD